MKTNTYRISVDIKKTDTFEDDDVSRISFHFFPALNKGRACVNFCFSPQNLILAKQQSGFLSLHLSKTAPFTLF